MSERLDGIRKATLENGLTVVLREMHYAPVASFWIWYRVGSRNEGAGLTGASHWVEHMLFKGTPTYPQGQFDRLIAREGGAFNGMTWIDFTTYFESLPSDRIGLALKVEADRMANAVFEAGELELERQVVISERQGDENSPGWLLGEAVQAAAFQSHTYHHPVIGWLSDLETMTREQVYQHYRLFYAPNNAVIAMAGDFDADRMLGQIEDLFGRIPSGPPVPRVTAREEAQRGERRVTIEGPGNTSYVEIAYRAPAATHGDYWPMVVLDTILGGAKGMSLFGGGTSNRSSRLYRALVDTELAADADCSMSSTIDPYLLGFSATVRAGRTAAEVEAALDAVIREVVDQPVSEHELAKAIKQTKAQFAYSGDSVTDQAYWLGFSELVADVGWFEHFLARLEAVTISDVQRVARQYLRLNQRTVGWYVPAAEGDAAPDDAGDTGGQLD